MFCSKFVCGLPDASRLASVVVPILVKNGLKSVFLLVYGFVDERILATLRDGKLKVLAQMPDEVEFSRDTLKLHLKFHYRK